MANQTQPRIESSVRNFEDIPESERAKSIPAEDPEADLHADPDAEQADAELGLEAPAQWRVAKSLLVLREEINAMAPDRSKASDGTIGDPSHQGRNSDHNAWVRDAEIGVVTAMDITHDPNRGCDAAALAEAIRKRNDPRVKYIIWNRRIANSSPIRGNPAWTWRAYSGKNPHTKHIHISVKPEKGSYDSAVTWAIGLNGKIA